MSTNQRHDISVPRRPCRTCAHRVDVHQLTPDAGCTSPGCECLDSPELAAGPLLPAQ